MAVARASSSRTSNAAASGPQVEQRFQVTRGAPFLHREPERGGVGIVALRRVEVSAGGRDLPREAGTHVLLELEFGEQVEDAVPAVVGGTRPVVGPTRRQVVEPRVGERVAYGIFVGR